MNIEDIKNCGSRHLYLPFDENGKRDDILSKDISKNQLVFLYDKLYSKYLELYFENKRLKEELSDSENMKNDIENPNISNDNFTKMINEIIDKRIREKLDFKGESEMYSGYYATLTYDDYEIGSVCLENYYDE